MCVVIRGVKVSQATPGAPEGKHATPAQYAALSTSTSCTVEMVLMHVETQLQAYTVTLTSYSYNSSALDFARELPSQWQLWFLCCIFMLLCLDTKASYPRVLCQSLASMRSC